MDELRRVQKVYDARLSNAALTERYSLFGPGELLMLQRRERMTLDLLRDSGISTVSDAVVLEVGCGRGARLADFQRWGSKAENLNGIELHQVLAEQAKAGYPKYGIVRGSGHKLPFQDESFDIVVQSTVFSSILDDGLRSGIADEMIRVLKKDGVILWYDFRYPNPKNKDVRPVGKNEICALFPGADVHIRSVTLLPPLARRVAKWSPLLYWVMEQFPFLRSHYLATIKKGGM